MRDSLQLVKQHVIVVALRFIVCDNDNASLASNEGEKKKKSWSHTPLIYIHIYLLCFQLLSFPLIWCSDGPGLQSCLQPESARVEAGIPQEELDALSTGGIETFAQYAFCTSYQPGSGPDDALFDHLESLLGTKPSGAMASNYRRLFFESHSLALKDLQSRLERSDISEVKILPLAEKAQGIEDLRKRLPGVMLSSSLEPSHALVDKAVHQFEENCIKLIELTQCTSRESEIQNEKTMPQLTFDSTGK